MTTEQICEQLQGAINQNIKAYKIAVATVQAVDDLKEILIKNPRTEYTEGINFGIIQSIEFIKNAQRRIENEFSNVDGKAC